MLGRFRRLRCSRAVAANLMGPVDACSFALPYLKKTHGSIVFISGLAGLHGLAKGVIYSASKMALTARAQGLRAELSPFDVHVGVLFLGFTRNDPDKLFYRPDGTLGPITRPFRYHLTQEMVAREVLKLIRFRRRAHALTPLGLGMRLLSRISPRVHFGFECLSTHSGLHRMSTEDKVNGERGHQ